MIKTTNKSVIKSIANAALNAGAGDVLINQSDKKLFQSHRSTFEFLIEKHSVITIKHYLTSNKKKVLTLIPKLLTCVLKSIGSSFINKNVRVQKIHPNKSEGTRTITREADQRIQSECEGSCEN